MSSNQESLNTLNEIRDLMERSSKFLSLSGLSGVFAGIFALIGAIAAFVRFKTDFYTTSITPSPEFTNQEVISFLLIDGLIVLVLSLAMGILFTIRKARKRGLQIWNSSSKRLLIGMFIPLAAGGIFCIAMLQYGYIWLVFPVTLLFYGLALVNASRFTYPEVFYLGISEIVLGCIALFLTGYSLIFWGIGFGLLHIIYGATMYNKYDRETVGNTTAKTITGLSVILFLFTISPPVHSQTVSDTLGSPVKKWYDKETIYLQGGNSYVKNNILYKGQKALKNEFSISEGGMQLYLKSKRTRNIALVISLAGSAGSIVSLISGDRDNLRKFFWVSLGTGLVSSVVTAHANNQRDQAVWLRNRDAMFLIDAQNNEIQGLKP